MTGILALLAAGAKLKVTASTTAPYGSIATAGTATTNTCALSVLNGSGSYSVAWSYVSGDASIAISSATGMTVTWSRVMNNTVASYSAIWQAVVTDTVTGATDSVSVTATLERV